MNSGATMRLRYVVNRDDFALNIDTEIPLRGVTGIYGASGAGKTTLLRCIAGLEEPDEGSLSVDGNHWQGAGLAMPANAREVGYVFQEPRLFSHLSVQQNIEYGWRRRKNSSGPDIDNVVQLLGLGNLLLRRPAELSGGEAQRVAIARAVLRAPRVVLMDEPLASLDAERKSEILPFLERLHTESSLPIIYVSHSIEEICRLCDHLLVLSEGEIVASGELQSVLVDLDVPALAGDEAGSVIAGQIGEFDPQYELSRVEFAGGAFWLPGKLGDVGDSLRLRIRASDVSLARERPGQSTILNLLEVVIEEIQDTPGPAQLVRLIAGQERLLARITRRSRQELNLQPGDKVVAQVKAAAVRGPKMGEAGTMKRVTVTIAALLLASTAMAQQDRSNMWEFGVSLNDMSSVSLKGSNGSSIDIDGSTGFGLSLNYNFNNHFALGGEFTWNAPDYKALFIPTDPGQEPQRINYEMDMFGVNLKGVWNVIDGPITPYLELGLGWMDVDSNVVDQPPITGCWWDPWWGYICDTFYSTYGKTQESYNGAAGVSLGYGQWHDPQGQLRILESRYQLIDGGRRARCVSSRTALALLTVCKQVTKPRARQLPGFFRIG